MSLRISLGGHEFNAGAPVDDVRWSLDLTAGWWDGPDMDVDLLPTIGEGSALGRVMLRHRTVVGHGVATALSQAAHDHAHLALEELVSPYVEVPLVVHERTGARQLMVRATSSPVVRCHGRAIEFQLTLVATNPHKQPYTEEP